MGWIKLHRQTLEKAIWKCSTGDQKAVFIAVLLLANHDSNQWIWKGKQYKCEPGEFITSLSNLAHHSGTSVKTVRNAIAKFQKLGFLGIKGASDGTKVTICNWDNYQGNGAEGGQAKGQEGGKRGASNNKDKNDKKIIFDEFRKQYPGKKRGLETEFDNFVKKHKDWNTIVDNLTSILNTQKKIRAQRVSSGVWVEGWQNLQTWINQRSWEYEYSDDETKPTMAKSGTRV